MGTSVISTGGEFFNHVVINKDSELLEQIYEDRAREDADRSKNQGPVITGQDLPGMDTFEQNAAELNTAQIN